jgi:hypothetical protein
MEETSRVFMRIESVIHNLDLKSRRPESWSEETVYWIRHVWGTAFRRSPFDWQERVIGH